MHVDAHAHGPTDQNIALHLPLILGGHGNHRQREIGGETQNAGVREVHAFGSEASLAADDGDGASLRGGAHKIAKLRKHHVAAFHRSAFADHQHNLSAEALHIFEFAVEIKIVGGHDVGFDATGRGGTGPAHGVDVQRAANGREQFGLGHAARPSAPHGKFFGVHIFESDSAHFGNAPIDGALSCRRTRDAGANIIAQLRKIFEGG